MRVLVACEESGTARAAFRALGHEAWSCDLEPPRGPYAMFHHRGDVRDVLGLRWDLIIAHPPCTRLANSGVRWLAERNLWGEMEEGAAFFNLFKGAAPRVCIENPVMHPYARDLCGKWTQTIQPWQFGEPFFKRTCLWLENLPPLVHGPVRTDVPNKKTEPERHAAWSKVHRCPPGVDRAKIRSESFPGIARAMAEQWGRL